jgi:FkbM family methyltransferase
MPLPSHVLSSRADLEEASRKKAAGVYYGEHRMLCRLLGEYLSFVDTRDLILGPRLVLDGFWEAWVTLAVARHLQPGMWCVDVGANYGYYTLLMAAAVGPEGRVLACEPHPLLAENYLPQNLALNALADRVDVCRVAIGDRDDELVEFALHAHNLGASSLAGGQGGQQTVRVPSATLDRLCADWPRLDLVKIDVEGAEALVWGGMQQTLRRFPHAAVVLELHLQRDPPQTIGFLHEIERAGYALRAINYDGDIVPVEADTILAQPQEHWALWLRR